MPKYLEKEDTLIGFRRAALVGLLVMSVSALTVAGFGSAFAAQHQTAMKDTLTVKITDTGTVWVRSRSRTSRRYGPPRWYLHGSEVHLPHTAHGQAHPVRDGRGHIHMAVKDWTVLNGTMKPATKMGTKLPLTISGGKATVTANYVLA